MVFLLKKSVLILLFSLISTFGDAQNFGATGGLTFSFGNKVDRIGIYIGSFYNYGFVQLNYSGRLTYNFKKLATNKKTMELQLSIGGLLGYGQQDSISNPMLSIIGNQTKYQNSFSYVFNRYWNQIKTTQSTGTVAFQFNKFTIASENDIFAHGWQDRFRTGAILVQYQYQNTKISINNTLWTGDYSQSKAITSDEYPSRYGHRNQENSVYGNFSAGLLSLQVEQLLPFGQVARANLGADSEYIRNMIQNKIMHDMYFLPKKWVKTNNLHLPMLDTVGKHYLYKDKQKVKKSTVYFNLGLNDNLFY